MTTDMPRRSRVARLSGARLPTRLGSFEAFVFTDRLDGSQPIALVHGDIAASTAPLVRLHSECWTGDVVGSLRCDCGEQLGRALTAITSDGAGVLLYLRQEGRGIGLANKMRAYELQDGGLDTVDANAALGLPVDARDYGGAAAILIELGLRGVRLMTNNPDKVTALEAAGISVERVPVTALPTVENSSYLETKIVRLGHSAPSRAPRPPVTIHYAQTLDGRLATRTGDSQWISSEPSTRLAHGLRASHAAVMVGAGTVLADDPRLTPRLVEGPAPIRVVVDSTLRLPPTSHVVTDGAAPTLLATTPRATHSRRRAFAGMSGVDVLVLPATADGRVALGPLLDELGRRGLASVLVEGGAALITTLLREKRVRRLVVSIAPIVMGAGIEAIGDLDIVRLRDALAFRRASFSQVGPDVIFDGEMEPWSDASA